MTSPTNVQTGDAQPEHGELPASVWQQMAGLLIQGRIDREQIAHLRMRVRLLEDVERRLRAKLTELRPGPPDARRLGRHRSRPT